LIDEGDSFYAGIPWNDAPKNQRILLGWLQPGGKETFPWKGQMSIPRDLSLKTTPDGIRVFQQPSKIISNNLVKHSGGKLMAKQNVILTENTDLGTTNNSYWIDAEFSVIGTKKVGFKVAQLKDEQGNLIKEIEVGYDVANKQLYVDCSRSEQGIKNKKNILQTATINPVNGKVRLQILLDKSSLEVFGNGGEKVITTMVFPEANATSYAAFAIGGKATLTLIKVWDLSKGK